MGNSSSKPQKQKKPSSTATTLKKGSSESSNKRKQSNSHTSSSKNRNFVSSEKKSSQPPTIVKSETIQSTRSIRSSKKNKQDNNKETVPAITISNSTEGSDVSKQQSTSPPINSNSIYNGQSHQRHHSLGYIPQHDTSDVQSNISSNQLHLSPNSNGGSNIPKISSISRRLSYNTNVDLPPSMMQLQPKSPILKNYKHSHSTSSFTNNENALTDDEAEGDESNVLLQQRANSRSRVSMSGYVGSSSPSGRPESVRSSRSRRKSDNVSDLSDMAMHQHLMTRSNSHASSLTSGNTTVYNTPLNSPALLTNGKEAGDYFSSASSTAQTNSVSNENIPGHSFTKDFHGLLKHPMNSYLDAFPSGVSNETSLLDTVKVNDGRDEDNNSQHGSNKKKKPLKPINIDETIQKLLDAGYAAKKSKTLCLKNSEIGQICQQSREILLSQPPLLELSPPVKIVGDVHGQYGDLLRLFTKCGFPPAANYLFLGDYVDRGKQSLETILLLLCYKIKYPENFFLLRGNHECANVTRVYGFYDECKRRCNIKTWKVFVDTFNTLPLAAIVTGKIFCVHGGLSPILNSMDEIRHVSRPTDVPDFGLINDLLWSDPTDSPNEWEDNERGVSYCYNKVAINKFLNKFGFDLVCRAHMVVEDGYEFFNDRSLVTVFSAPNYCGEFDNWGAVMSVSEGLLCSFELLDPLDSAALKQVMKKGRQERKLANQQQQLQIQ